MIIKRSSDQVIIYVLENKAKATCRFYKTKQKKESAYIDKYADAIHISRENPRQVFASLSFHFFQSMTIDV